MPEKGSMDKAFIKKLIDILDINLENENFWVVELATEVGLSRSQLHRRLKDINGKSTSQFIREYRLEKAMDMLKQNQATASEIAYRVGFTSPTYFNTCFHNFYGYPPGEVKNQNAIAPPKKTFAKKVVSTIPVIILVGFIVISQIFNKDTVDATSIEKTIAVLPFVNNSNDEDNMYFCNGIMAGIRDHLAKIPELYVVSRRSVESYRNTSIPLKTIAKELDVNYVIEGHVQRIGNRAIISAELINVSNNKVLWSESYDKDVSEVFDVQANVIQSITSNLEIIISPNLKTELITRPTQNSLAYDHYLKGEEYRFKANRELQKNEEWLDLLNKAKLSYELAIERDSLFAQAYLGLAYNVFEKNSRYIEDSHNLNQVLSLTNKVIELNPNIALAYNLRGQYYENTLKGVQASMDFEKVIELNPNSGYAMFRLISIYKSDNNYIKALNTLKRFERMAKSKSELTRVYAQYCWFYSIVEQYNMVDYYLDKHAELYTDTYYNRNKSWHYFTANRFDESIAYIKKKCLVDNQERNAYLGFLYFQKRDYKQALDYLEKCYNQVAKEGINSSPSAHVYSLYGETLVRSGQIEKGAKIKQRQIDLSNKILSTRDYGDNRLFYYQLILLYASLDQNEKAYDYMKKFKEANGWLYPGLVSFSRFDVYFDGFRDDPQFVEFLKNGEKQLAEVQNQIRPHLPTTPPTKTD